MIRVSSYFPNLDGYAYLSQILMSGTYVTQTLISLAESLEKEFGVKSVVCEANVFQRRKAMQAFQENVCFVVQNYIFVTILKRMVQLKRYE